MSASAEEARYRVSVCLERFFSDERARCFVSVSGARPVRWLRRRLRRLFPLPRRVALLSRGHLLPPDEPLSLLRPDDVVQVIPKTEDTGNQDKRLDSVIEFTKISTPMADLDQMKWKRKKKSCVHQETQSNSNIDSYIRMDESNTEIMSEVIPQAAQSPNNHPHSEGLSVTHSDNSEMTVAEPSDIDPLEQMKERALALLDGCAPPRRRRRRVRRRRARNLSLLSEIGSIMPAETELNLTRKEYENVTEHLQTCEQESEPTFENVVMRDLESIGDEQNIESTKSFCDIAKTSASQYPVTSEAGLTSSYPQSPADISWKTYAEPAAPIVVRNNAVIPRGPRVVRPLPLV